MEPRGEFQLDSNRYQLLHRDFYTYSSTQSAPVSPVPATGAGQNTFGTTIGPNFWPLTSKLSSTGATWVPQVSIALNDVSAVQQQAMAAVSGIGLSNIDSMEIGNEPTLLPNGQSTTKYTSGLNNTSWVGPLRIIDRTDAELHRYSNRFKQYAAAIASAVPIPATSEPFFEAGDLADLDSRISVGNLLIQNITTGGYVKSFGLHYYQLIGSDTLYGDLLDHSRTYNQANLQRAYLTDLRENTSPVIPLIMSEVNVLTGGANITFLQSLGVSVWMVDYMLYMMSIGVKRVHWESVFSSGQATFMPSTSGSQVAGTGAAYYSLPATAEFIGNTGGTSQVAQVAVNGTNNNNRFTAYASYNGTTLARMALINLNPWSTSDSSDRPTVPVSLSIPISISSVVVKYLNSPGGAYGANTTITYGGSQWTYASLGNEVTGVRNDTVNLPVVSGAVTIIVPHTSVAMVFLQK